ncbi:polysaccharide deacetylase family protein [Dokdonia sp. Hel_I_53]|uniref:polysaccharide deacetylase family protein n=1 Tax=Dokdonia sp. Hel_I_53 TaxID=1566287 RepID=UPI00119C8A2B|nr:polysaccharide deacetylase [Dokdonia sp. Hel_I_53]TVZ51348.1 hypothetical protein OD90_0486 [Dokdonia sp. Hel_I_53]
MHNSNGTFVISLDYELMWGVRDKRSVETYGDAILGGRNAIVNMVELFRKYNVRASFATVGFLFHKDKDEFFKSSLHNKPDYSNKKLSPFQSMEEELGEDECDDPYHYGWSLTQFLLKQPHIEVSTHTYSHYYCLEEGQDILSFENDIKTALETAKKYNLNIETIIFPRNQIQKEYLDLCYNLGLLAYRGTEKSIIYKSNPDNKQHIIKRGFRLLDAYFNISGHNTYTIDDQYNDKILNIRSSSFLRPYSKRLSFLENLKIERIKKSMSYAAKNGEVYHLWWHPHNFGRNKSENLNNLRKILEHYILLNNTYNFESLTMKDLANRILEK